METSIAKLAMQDMVRYHEQGFTTWDLADIYGPAENFIGEFRRYLLKLKGKDELDKVRPSQNGYLDPDNNTFND